MRDDKGRQDYVEAGSVWRLVPAFRRVRRVGATGLRVVGPRLTREEAYAKSESRGYKASIHGTVQQVRASMAERVGGPCHFRMTLRPHQVCECPECERRRRLKRRFLEA